MYSGSGSSDDREMKKGQDVQTVYKVCKTFSLKLNEIRLLFLRVGRKTGEEQA